MSALSALDATLSFYKEVVSPSIRLQKATESLDEYELVNPSVHEGWINPDGREDSHAVPGILVSHDKAKCDRNEKVRKVNIIVTYVVYSPGDTLCVDGVYDTKITFKGYRDLVNLMDRAEYKLLNTPDVMGFDIDGEIESEIYRESVFPYFYGMHKFTLTESISNNCYKYEL